MSGAHTVEQLDTEVMSDAQNCPLLHRINALQMQPMQHHPSSDTVFDPDNIIPLRYNLDKPDAPVPDPEPPPSKIHTTPNIGDACTPPIARTAQIRRMKTHNVTKHKVYPPPHLKRDLTTVVRAQLDTGADITCTNIKAVLHNCKPHSQSFPCRVRLVGAIGKTGEKDVGMHLLGKGTLHIPALTSSGFIPVRCVCSPHLTTTLPCEDNILRSQHDL